LRVIGFEPDEQECTRLRVKQPFVRFEPLALGAVDGPHPLYITAHPGCTSCLEPDASVLDTYPIRKWFRVERTANVEIRRYDTLRTTRDLPAPDFIQIDVQGFEAQALEGFGPALDTVVGIEAESHLRQVYKGQSVLTDLRDLLERRGLLLRHIRPQGAFEGEAIELNAWFTRRLDACTPEQRSLAAIWETMCMLPPAEHFAG
jgi:FkbM family methyltransferase